MMHRLFTIFFLIVCLPAHAFAQADDSLLSTNLPPINDSTGVMQAIKVFFDGLAAQDSTLMMSVSDPDARLVLTSSKADGTPLMRAISIQQFVSLIISAQGADMLETYWAPQVKIHDNLASVWLNYNFYVGEVLDHCGEDNFQLYRSTQGWKIAAIADTQRRIGCEPEE